LVTSGKRERVRGRRRFKFRYADVIAVSGWAVCWLEGLPQMGALSLARLLAAVGTLALSLTPGTGVASADPDLSPVINTTCNYSQVVSAINVQSPPAGAALSASPTAQAVLRGFLASSPDQRQQIIQELESKPESQPYFQQYVGAVLQVANTCNNF
jgi:hemophore-related protein